MMALATDTAGRLRDLHSRRDALEAEIARENSRLFYSQPEMVGEVSRAMRDQGLSIFETHRLGHSDEDHAARLLDAFRPPEGATILDAGCGVGGLALAMKRLRPDLDFILLNSSPEQLALCPEGFQTVLADFHDTTIPPDSVDAVMFAFSLGHSILHRVLAEARRILKPGGRVFIYDLTTENTDRLIVALGYKAYSEKRLREVAADLALTVDFVESPECVSHAPIFTKEQIEDLFAGVGLILARLTKPKRINEMTAADLSEAGRVLARLWLPNTEGVLNVEPK